MSYRVTLDTSLSTNIDSQEVYCFADPNLRYTVHGDVGTISYDGFTGQVDFYATPLGSNVIFAQWEYRVGASGVWLVSTNNPFCYNGEEDITIYAVGVATNNSVRVTLRDGSYNGGASDIEEFLVTLTANNSTDTVPDLAFIGGTKASAYVDLTPGGTLKIYAEPNSGKTFLGWLYSYQSPSGRRFNFFVPGTSLTIKVLANTEITACVSRLIPLFSGGEWHLPVPCIYSGGQWQRAASYLES